MMTQALQALSALTKDQGRYGQLLEGLITQVLTTTTTTTTTTRCVALPSLVTARWVCQNSGPIFRRLMDQSTPN